MGREVTDEVVVSKKRIGVTQPCVWMRWDGNGFGDEKKKIIDGDLPRGDSGDSDLSVSHCAPHQRSVFTGNLRFLLLLPYTLPNLNINNPAIMHLTRRDIPLHTCSYESPSPGLSHYCSLNQTRRAILFFRKRPRTLENERPQSTLTPFAKRAMHVEGLWMEYPTRTGVQSI